MPNSWETLFHLSNFMKHLLHEVLPEEKVSYPSYTLDSLFELLNSTLRCINLVQQKHSLQSVAYQKIENEAKRISSQYYTNEAPYHLKSDPNLKIENQLCEQEQKNYDLASVNQTSKKKKKKSNNPDPPHEFYNPQNEPSVEAEDTPMTNYKPLGVPCMSPNNETSIELSNSAQDEAVLPPNEPEDQQNLNDKSVKKKKKKVKDIDSSSEISTSQNTHGLETEKLDPTSTSSVDEQFMRHRIKERESLKQIISGSGIVTRHQNIILSKNFLFLNEEVVRGNDAYGCFCMPCDKCFFNNNDWQEHSRFDLNHDSYQSKTSCEKIFCEFCDFHVYGNIAVASVYLDYHSLSHTSSCGPNSDKNAREKVDSIQQNYANNSINTTEITNNSSSSTLVDCISNNFKVINSKICLGSLKEGYYCGVCDFYYDSNNDWLFHLNEYHKIIEKTCNFDSCHICSFVIFSTNDSLNNLSSFHVKFHENISRPESGTCSRGRSLESLSGISRSDSTLELNSATKGRKNSDTKVSRKLKTNKSKKDESGFIICENFKQLNQSLHDQAISEAYYCRPCDTIVENEGSWMQHCRSRRHDSFMSNKSFRNQEATCSYCKLLFVGSINVVRQYMMYHATGHGKQPSYDTKDIVVEEKSVVPSSIESNSNYENEPGPVCRRKERKKRDSIIQNETMENEQNIDTIQDNREVKTIKDVVENNCDPVLNGNAMLNKIKGLQLARKKDKLSGKPPLFAGVCNVCNEVIEDAFDWMDHLILDGHQADGNEEIILNDLNLHIFGNKSIMKDLTS